MKKINLLLRKCKSLSRQLSRSSSYNNLRSKSTREDLVCDDHRFINKSEDQNNNNKSATIFVGSSKKRYIIGTKYLTHPLFEALLHKSSNIGEDPRDQDQDSDGDDRRSRVLIVKCEVVLFDHLLWMLENADPTSLGNTESFDELAALYVF